MPRRPRRRSHGQGSVWQRGPHSFVVRWREDGVRRISPAYESFDLADKVRAKIVADIAAGRAGLPRAEVATLAALGDAVIARRELTHRAWEDDRGRWRNHLKPALGSLPANEVSPAHIRKFVEKKLADRMNPATVGHCIRLLSTVYTDLVERAQETGVTSNPVRQLTRATRRLYRPSHDPTGVPFIERLEQVERVYEAIGSETVRTMFAVGVYAGLRPGEVKALYWPDVDLGRRRIRVWRQVVDSALGPLKDDETRTVPILAKLHPILTAWREKTDGEGQLFRPLKRGGGKPGAASSFVREHTLLKYLGAALASPPLKDLGLPPLTWYQATRHTFASQWVLQDGSMEKLAAILGHSSTEVTRRYGHLRTDLFAERDLNLFGGGEAGDGIEPKAGTFGHTVGTDGTNSEIGNQKFPL